LGHDINFANLNRYGKSGGKYSDYQMPYTFFPYKEVQVTPIQARMKYKEIVFASKDGKKLNGWFVPADDPKGVLLFCHGNADNISHRMESIKIFHDIGLLVIHD